MFLKAPEYTPYNKNKIIKEEPKRIKLEPKAPTKVSYVEEIKKPDTVMLESYYYGILTQDAVNFSAKPIKFKAQVNINSLILNIRVCANNINVYPPAFAVPRML